ncbi:scavenger receptor cysteine-rich type 1 protein M130-like [Centropristis striata]|uniref:scavenger receptor cysteine-rich type 1 protein M130-like n=1 Tax=Centropristis striata TaxID=184440 RepID=UPI0027DECD98|nr:scavenger receptor cysteine-rich type 1 protein M130-like [Centropristis striata]
MRRFIARRGTPFEILSDQGTNFRGADKELKEAFAAMESQLQERLEKKQIKFCFNPPASPHFGTGSEAVTLLCLLTQRRRQSGRKEQLLVPAALNRLSMQIHTESTNSVRLVNGTSVCSGRLEVKYDQSKQSWSSVCEDDFDQQDAEVVCRELGCGAPSVLQGALYGEGEAPMWAKEFQCGGNESALLDCRSSGSDRNTCSPGRAVGLTCSEPVRLVGGDSRCAGTLEMKHEGEWRPVIGFGSILKVAAVTCRYLDCGSAVSVRTEEYSDRYVWGISSDCVQSGSLRECAKSSSSSFIYKVNCSDSFRLVNGTGVCSGRLEVKSDQSNQSWSSVCEDDFDQQDAEVVCRELGCGAPSVLQGALYGEGEAPMWTKEFQCGGNESALLDCRSSGSNRTTCSPGRAVGLTCSEPFRLVGGDSRCAGTLEMKHEGEWRPVIGFDPTLKVVASLCRYLDCGYAVCIRIEDSSDRSVWQTDPFCVHSESLRECVASSSSSSICNVTCSDSVRLVNGTSVCSGRLEVKSDQSKQSWSSVCEDDFDQQDAEVVCRELGCGAPSVLQGALYGGGEAPMWTKEFQCGGNESALLDCRSSGSDRNTYSPGRAVGLTCSEPVRLVGEDSRCAGTLELKHEGEWRTVSSAFWTLKETASICRELDCGSAVSVRREDSSYRSVWQTSPVCALSESLRECVASSFHSSIFNVTCSDSVRLVNGNSLCSGRLEVKSDQSNQSWSSVCEDDFDQQDAEVVCRELGCGAPSVLQGALYGEVEAPMWTKEFHCGGNESALLDCRSSGSDRNTCSPGRAVGLTCSEPVRLVGGDSRCAGTLELKHEGEWRPVSSNGWTLKVAASLCRYLDCGSAVSVRSEESSERSMWMIHSHCVHSRSLRECALSTFYPHAFVNLTCSDLLLQPNISASSSMDGVSKAQQQGLRVFRGSNFTVSCSIKPQYPGGSFQLHFTSSTSAHTYTQPAGPPTKEATAVFITSMFSLITSPLRAVSSLSLLLTHRVYRVQKPRRREDVELDYYNLGVPAAEGAPTEELGAQGADSDPIRLVGEDSHCAGTLELKHRGELRPVVGFDWTLMEAASLCRYLDCGSAVSVRRESSYRSVWRIRSDCVQSGSPRECLESTSSSSIYKVNCSDSVRLVNGTSVCSGRLEVKSDQSKQSWSSVCEDDFDQKDAEVVCRELGCGAPSVLQGALYGEGEAPMWTKEFQCGGNESALLDCRSSGSDRNTCSPGRAVGLTCSEPVRLVGGNSRCAGTLELKHEGEWRPVDSYGWTLKEAAAACRELDCGSAVSVRREESSYRSVWWIKSHCFQSGSLRECAASSYTSPSFHPSFVNLTCSDLLLQPNISASSSMDGVSEAQQQGLRVLQGSNFTVSCSIQPQYPGGSFQLHFTSSTSAHTYTQPVVNHAAHFLFPNNTQPAVNQYAQFLFPAAEPAHQGSYSCVYHVHVFSHNFSSESRQLSLTVVDPRPFIIRSVVLPLILLLVIIVSYFYIKTHRVYRVQKPRRREDVELDYYNLGVPATEGAPTEELGAQGAK